MYGFDIHAFTLDLTTQCQTAGIEVEIGEIGDERGDLPRIMKSVFLSKGNASITINTICVFPNEEEEEIIWIMIRMYKLI